MIFLTGIVLITINFEWALQKAYAGNTVCTSGNTDWYTSVIGETPCRTYERLRQICNSVYQVGTLTRNTPPDHCDDQVQDCCCNSISFALSMLCLACQDNTANGFDAGVGAYQQYLLKDGKNICGPRKDKSLTTTIQNAVCNSGIKIEDQLYNLFWTDGQWFYVYTRDSIIRDHAAFDNKTQNKCPADVPPPAPPITSSTPSTAAPPAPTLSITFSTLMTTSLTAFSTPVTLSISSVPPTIVSSALLSSVLVSNTPSPSSDITSASTATASGDSGDSGLRSGKINDSSTDDGSGLGSGSIAGIVVGGIVIVVLLIVIVFLVLRYRQKAGRQEVKPYISESPGTVSPVYELPGVNPTRYLLDGEETTIFPILAASVHKPNHEQQFHQNPYSSTRITKSPVPSADMQQGPLISTGINHDPPATSHTGSVQRHIDAGPIIGANLGRSVSGRLPPAYGEQLRPAIRTANGSQSNNPA